MKTIALIVTAALVLSCSSTSKERRPASIPTPAKWIVHSHRGASHLPENMMSAFQCAAKLGADFIEMDLQMTKDDEVIVAHDAYVKQDCNDDEGKPVAAKSVFFRQTNWKNKLEKFDCGSRTSASHIVAVPGERLSTLAEVLNALKDVRNTRNTPVGFNIEIKYSSDKKHYPSRSHFAKKVMAVIEKSGIEEHRLLIQSFDVEVLQQVRKLHPTIRLSQLIGDDHAMAEAMDNLDSLNTDIITPHFGLISKELVDSFHARNARVVPWTVNSLESKQLVEAAGVDGVITDNLQLFHPEAAVACP